MVARGDLTKHEAVLTAIKTGVSVDERLSTPWMHGSAAGLDVLAGQKAESSALADVISAWNHQRNDWVKERSRPRPAKHACDRVLTILRGEAGTS